MQKFLLTLVVVIVFTFNLATDAKAKGKSTNNFNSFQLDISAISLETQRKDDAYHIIDYKIPSKDFKESYDDPYFPEVVTYIETELTKQNYKKSKWDKEEWAKDYDQQIPPKIKIVIHYRIFATQSINTNHISLYASSWSSHIPLWEISVNNKYAEGSLRILIPSMIKCAAPYFNKNFKGIIACQR